LIIANNKFYNRGVIVNDGMIILGPAGFVDGDKPPKKLIFDANGGVSTFTALEVGDTFKIDKLDSYPEILPKLTGYELMGWSEKSDGSAPLITGDYAFKNGTKLYAQWEKSSDPRYGSSNANFANYVRDNIARVVVIALIIVFVAVAIPLIVRSRRHEGDQQ